MPAENQEVIPTLDAPQNLEAAEYSQEEMLKSAMQFAFQEDPKVLAELSAQGGSPEDVTNPVTDAPAVAPAFNEAEYLKEFNVESKEALKARLAEYDTLKATPPTPSEIAFANEESKKIHQLLKEGKTKEVKAYLDAQQVVEHFDTLGPEEQVKQHIKSQYPEFTAQMVNHLFNKKYAVKDEGDYDDAMDYEVAKGQAAQDIKNDAAKAKDYFSTYRTQISLPDITPISTNADQDYEQYKASIAQADQTLNGVIIPSLKSLKESDLGMNLRINDAANHMQFDVSIAPDKADFDAAIAQAIDFNGWVGAEFYDADGKFRPTEVAKAILLKANFDKYATAIARQAVNAERKRLIEKETPNPSLQRQSANPSEELTEYQRQMRLAMSV